MQLVGEGLGKNMHHEIWWIKMIQRKQQFHKIIIQLEFGLDSISYVTLLQK